MCQPSIIVWHNPFDAREAQTRIVLEMVWACWSHAGWNRAQRKFREGRRPGRVRERRRQRRRKRDMFGVRYQRGTEHPSISRSCPASPGSKQQQAVVVVTSAAEYVSLSQGLLSILQLRNWRRSVGQGVKEAMAVCEDSVGAVALVRSDNNEYLHEAHTDAEFHCLRRSVLWNAIADDRVLKLR